MILNSINYRCKAGLVVEHSGSGRFVAALYIPNLFICKSCTICMQIQSDQSIVSQLRNTFGQVLT